MLRLMTSVSRPLPQMVPGDATAAAGGPAMAVAQSASTSQLGEQATIRRAAPSDRVGWRFFRTPQITLLPNSAGAEADLSAQHILEQSLAFLRGL